MLYKFLGDKLSDNVIVIIGPILAFIVTFVLLAKPFEFLPRDGGKFVTTKDGKKVAVNEASNGKVTGVGLVFISVYLLFTLVLLPVSTEMILYIVLSIAMMLTGFLDDASKSPWGELVKGILDLVLAIITVVVFLKFNSSDVAFFGIKFHMPVVIYFILALMLIWASINVTNCSDGVDGLCGTVSVIEIFAINAIFGSKLGVYSGMSMILAFVLVAYLAYNWFPSTALMGDAGSRTIGFTLALMCMKTGHPFAFLLLSLVFILDGGLGLLKLAVMRVFKIKFLANILCPLHDELRKKHKWRVPNIVILFAFCQIILSLIVGVIIRFTGI